jgi:non-ribosomal peptide synthetase component F
MELPPALVRILEVRAALLHTTLFSLLMAALVVALHLESGEEDIVLGVAIDLRGVYGSRQV